MSCKDDRKSICTQYHVLKYTIPNICGFGLSDRYSNGNMTSIKADHNVFVIIAAPSRTRSESVAKSRKC